MASSQYKYARNIAPARFQTQGGTQSVPVSGRNGPKIDPSLFSGKTAPKGGAGGLESRQIPAAIQEAGPEAMSVEGGEASMQPQMVTETQQPIENRGGSARYMIQGGGPRIDLSFLVPERANKAFDPSKAIGGENVPFQESKGVGGFFRRMLGDESNQQNIAAQQAQGAEWRQEAKELKAEERLLNRMREADKPTQSRFEATQASNLASETTRNDLTREQMKDLRDDRIARLNNEVADRNARVAEWENSRLFSAGEGEKVRGFQAGEGEKSRTFQAGQAAADRGFRSSEGAADRAFRTGESQADRAARLAEGEANRALTAAHYNLVREDNAADRGLRANEGAANRALTSAHYNLIGEDNAANRTLRASEGAANRAIDEARLGLQREGQASDVTYRQRPQIQRLGDNVYTNEKGEVFEHTPGMPAFGKNKGTPGGFRRLPMPGAMAPKGSGGGQVDRGTGATLGGALPAGGGVRLGGALPAPMPQNTALVPRFMQGTGDVIGSAATSATDPLRNMGTSLNQLLFNSQAQQDPEVLKRMKARMAVREGDGISMGSDPMFY
jgi:hypothetical protein